MGPNRNKTENKEALLGQVTEFLTYDERLWPEFLVADCREFVDNLHSYRLTHLLDNIEGFVEYIDHLSEEYEHSIADDILAPQAQATTQALFLLSCTEFASASKERMMIREMETVKY